MTRPLYDMLGILAVLTCLVLLLNCGEETAGIETTNGDVTIAAAEGTISGTAPALAKIAIFEINYVPVVDSGLALTTTVSRSGEYGFEHLPSGTYTLIAENAEGTKAVMFNDIELGQSSVSQDKSMKPMGAVKGIVVSDKPAPEGIFVFLVGTGYSQVLPGPGPFLFESLPPGQYKVQASLLSASDESVSPIIMTETTGVVVDVGAGAESKADTLVVP